jgi:hypothetical protein
MSDSLNIYGDGKVGTRSSGRGRKEESHSVIPGEPVTKLLGTAYPRNSLPSYPLIMSRLPSEM